MKAYQNRTKHKFEKQRSYENMLTQTHLGHNQKVLKLLVEQNCTWLSKPLTWTWQEMFFLNKKKVITPLSPKRKKKKN